MAVKTITIDMEAYEILSREKLAQESFSKVIKRRIRSARTAGDILTDLDKICRSERTLSNIEKVIGSRRKSPARSASVNT